MLVCVCKGVSDRHIDEALQNGASSYTDVRVNLGVGSCCGQCAAFAKEMVSEKIADMQTANAFHLASEIRI